jgi:hypothetical protein
MNLIKPSDTLEGSHPHKGIKVWRIHPVASQFEVLTVP